MAPAVLTVLGDSTMVKRHKIMPEQDNTMRVVLITGAFGGIGQTTALMMARAGWTVYAAGRTMAKSAELMASAEAAGVAVHPIVMDVTDEGSIGAALDRIRREVGRLDVLVNNAGMAVHGAVTETSTTQIRRQFETNTIAAVATSRAALELMSRHGGGRIINVSSIMGKMAFPGAGLYCASKHALEGLSDTMRLEFKLIGPAYHVILIQVPVVKTRLGANAIFAEYGGRPDSLYGDFNALAHDFVNRTYDRGIAPEVVAQAILHAASVPRPKTRYVVTMQAKLLLALRRVLPDRAFDRVVLSLTPRLKRQITERAGSPARNDPQHVLSE